MITSILIANRGEIACRIMRTCQYLGIRTVAVYSDADADALHVHMADEAYHVGAAPAAESYLVSEKIIHCAQQAGVDAIHPGFGFLAEDANFVRACSAAGFIFIGPTAVAMATMGNKSTAKALAQQINVPVIPGYGSADQTDERFLQEATQIGYPVIVKAAAGGGGKGMRVVANATELPTALESARHEALQAFGSDELLLEKALCTPRHIEIQLLGDIHGNILHLGERDCSIQRRHQKIIEETPVLSPEQRAQMGTTAVAIAKAIHYTNAGTIEFLLEPDGSFYFLEMNTRLQVEHPITEMVTGIDLVEWQIRIAEGEVLPWTQDDIQRDGHAIEARIYAENPANDFLPVTGDILYWQPPKGAGIRVESGIQSHDFISVHYDPMLAKIIAHGPDRKTAVRRLQRALATAVLLGSINNLAFLQDVIKHPVFISGAAKTDFIPKHMCNWHSQPGNTTQALIAASLAQFVDHLQIESNAGYWRNNANRPLLYRFSLADVEEPITVAVTPDKQAQDQFAITLSTKPDTSHAVILHDRTPNRVVFTVDGHRQSVTIESDHKTWWMQTSTGVVVATAVSLLPKPHPTADAAGSLRAPMPGSVLAVLVECGQEITAGQPLMKLEAMKMEHTIRSAAPGIVAEIYFEVGESVTADAQLLQIVDLP